MYDFRYFRKLKSHREQNKSSGNIIGYIKELPNEALNLSSKSSSSGNSRKRGFYIKRSPPSI